MADVPQNTQPNASPDGSNIYIRTMGQDVQNLNQGGGNFSPGLGSEQKPVDLGQVPTSAPTPVVAPSMDDLQKKIQDMASGPTSVSPTVGYTEVAPNIPVTPEVASSMPLNPEPSPIPTPVATPEPMPVSDPNTISFNPMEVPSAPMAETVINNEPVIGAADIATYAKPKKNILKLLIPIIIIIVLVGFYFLVWPKLFKPKSLTSTIPGLDNPSLTSPLKTQTTPTTLPPVLSFSTSKGDVINTKLAIDVTGAPMFYTDIKKEANTLGTTNQIKVLQPTVKGQALTSQEVLFTWMKNVPESLVGKIGEEYIFYTYYGEVHPALGLVFKLKTTGSEELQEVKDIMLAWEKNKALVKDSANLWLFTPKTTTAKTFKEKEILGTMVRYYAYPGTEAALSYTVLDDKLIITTSLESMTSAIDHLSINTGTSTTTKLIIPEVPDASPTSTPK